MNKKIIMSMLSVAGALTIMGGSALAAFTTSADLKTNTFSTTNPNLQVSKDNSTYGVQIDPGFTETGIVPGAASNPHTFYLKNFDIDPGATMTINGQFTITSGSGSYLDNLSVKITCDNGGSITKSVTDWKNTAWGLGTLAPNTITTCTMSASLPGGDTTDANQSVTFDAVFGGSVGT